MHYIIDYLFVCMVDFLSAVIYSESFKTFNFLNQITTQLTIFNLIRNELICFENLVKPK